MEQSLVDDTIQHTVNWLATMAHAGDYDAANALTMLRLTSKTMLKRVAAARSFRPGYPAVLLDELRLLAAGRANNDLFKYMLFLRLLRNKGFVLSLDACFELGRALVTMPNQVQLVRTPAQQHEFRRGQLHGYCAENRVDRIKLHLVSNPRLQKELPAAIEASDYPDLWATLGLAPNVAHLIRHQRADLMSNCRSHMDFSDALEGPHHHVHTDDASFMAFHQALRQRYALDWDALLAYHYARTGQVALLAKMGKDDYELDMCVWNAYYFRQLPVIEHLWDRFPRYQSTIVEVILDEVSAAETCFPQDIIRFAAQRAKQVLHRRSYSDFVEDAYYSVYMHDLDTFRCFWEHDLLPTEEVKQLMARRSLRDVQRTIDCLAWIDYLEKIDPTDELLGWKARWSRLATLLGQWTAMQRCPMEAGGVLHFTTEHGYAIPPPWVVQRLVAMKEHADTREQWTWIAAHGGQLSTLEAMNAKSSMETLRLAVRSGSIPTLRYLLKHYQPDPNAPVDHDLFKLAAELGDIKAMTLINEASPRKLVRWNASALTQAMSHNHLSAIEWFAENNCYLSTDEVQHAIASIKKPETIELTTKRCVCKIWPGVHW